MKAVFADAWFWVAITNPEDNYHEQAFNLRNTLKNTYIVTTDEVLTEVLTFFSSKGFQARPQAIQLVEALLQSDDIEVIPQSRDSFLSGLQLYKERPDKRYSLQDCISMQTMKAMEIQEVLTQDHHFIQEGFKSLLG